MDLLLQQISIFSLYNYQWMTNFPGQNLNNLKNLDKKTNLNESFLAKTKSKLKNYLNNRRNIDFKNVRIMSIFFKNHRH